MKTTADFFSSFAELQNRNRFVRNLASCGIAHSNGSEPSEEKYCGIKRWLNSLKIGIWLNNLNWKKQRNGNTVYNSCSGLVLTQTFRTFIQLIFLSENQPRVYTHKSYTKPLCFIQKPTAQTAHLVFFQFLKTTTNKTKRAVSCQRSDKEHYWIPIHIYIVF